MGLRLLEKDKSCFVLWLFWFSGSFYGRPRHFVLRNCKYLLSSCRSTRHKAYNRPILSFSWLKLSHCWQFWSALGHRHFFHNISNISIKSSNAAYFLNIRFLALFCDEQPIKLMQRYCTYRPNIYQLQCSLSQCFLYAVAVERSTVTLSPYHMQQGIGCNQGWKYHDIMENIRISKISW